MNGGAGAAGAATYNTSSWVSRKVGTSGDPNEPKDKPQTTTGILPPLLPDIVTIDINLSAFKLPVSPLTTEPPNLTPPELYKSARGGLEQQQQRDVCSSVTAVWQRCRAVSSRTGADM